MQTGQFGNMLLLDDDPNLADSDKPYTEVDLLQHKLYITQCLRPLSEMTLWNTKVNRC